MSAPVDGAGATWTGGPVYGQDRATEDMEIALSRRLHVAFASEHSGVGKTELTRRYCEGVVCLGDAVRWARARLRRLRSRRTDAAAAGVGGGVGGGGDEPTDAEARRLATSLFCLTLAECDQTLEAIVDKVQTFARTRASDEPRDQIRVVRLKASAPLSVEFQNALRRFMEMERLVFVMETRTTDYFEDAFRSRWTVIRLAPLALPTCVRLLTDTASALTRAVAAAASSAVAGRKRGAPSSYGNASLDDESAQRARKGGGPRTRASSTSSSSSTSGGGGDSVVLSPEPLARVSADAGQPPTMSRAPGTSARAGPQNYSVRFLERVAAYARGDARRALQALYNASRIGTAHVEHLMTLQTGATRATERVLEACARGHREAAFAAARDFDAARFTVTEFIECATRHVEALAAATAGAQARAQSLLQCATRLQMYASVTSTQSVVQLYGAVARLLVDLRFRYPTDAGPGSASRV